MRTDDGLGWTVILRRQHLNVSFNRDWYGYKVGFGEPEHGDFWLGLENIYRITNQVQSNLSL